MKTNLLIAAMILATSATASAGGQSGSIGVGVERQINGEAGGVSANYDAGQFHVGGFFSFSDSDGDNNHFFSLGGRFFYHLHQTAMSDFGAGLGLGIASLPDPTMADPGNRATHLFIEPSVQIRVFVASNVALSFTAGLVLGALDANGFSFDGQGIGLGAGNGTIGLPTASAGVHYYFF
ncbi:MAG: hypothetical protein NT062_35005 [Proteobacteria bacterium]|nr:hypothetical protein [Pseudomonadota bacterium]